MVTVLFLAVGAMAFAAESKVGLGNASGFAVLAGETITNAGSSTITGDVGLHPGTATTGFGNVTLDGEKHVANDEALAAKNSLKNAYNDAVSRGPASLIPTELGGQVLTPGVYSSGSGTFGITGTVILDAEGDPDAVWIFQMASTLVTASGGTVRVVNEARACNIYWQVGTSATLGTGTRFRGTIMAKASITLNTGATVTGGVMARNGSVTMDGNTITSAVCAGPDVVTPTTTATTSGTTTTTLDGTGTTSTTIPLPEGAVGTGGGSTAGGTNLLLLLAGGGLLGVAVGAFGYRQLELRRSRSG